MRTLALLAVAAAIAAPAATAHNAGHMILPDGTCQNVGSGNSAPFVPEQNPNRNTTPGTDYGRLDLEPGRGDQYGARFAADQGQSQVEPRFCEEIGLTPRN